MFNSKIIVFLPIMFIIFFQADAISVRKRQTGGWTEGIKCVFGIGPIDCLTAKSDATTASNDAKAKYPANTQHNGVGDAYRHCLWNALMAIHIGVTQAKTVADNHEAPGVQVAGEKKMDLRNNEIGREVGRQAGKNGEAKAKAVCAQHVASGYLLLKP